jgi:hypothetical protein
MFLNTTRGRCLVVFCLLLLPSCGNRTKSLTGTPRSSNVLVADELEEVFRLNALQAVELLRPNWLRNRGAVTMESSASQGVRVYVDGSPRGFSQDLEGILVPDILEMRFLDSREATTRYGTGYPDGVIVVRTRQDWQQ